MPEIIIRGRKKNANRRYSFNLFNITSSMWDLKKILSLENFVYQQRCAWDFSMRMAMAKIRSNGFERRESFEDMWKDIYHMDGCF